MKISTYSLQVSLCVKKINLARQQVPTNKAHLNLYSCCTVANHHMYERPIGLQKQLRRMRLNAT